MEEKINIAEILKDKPKGIRLYSPIFGECAFSFVQEETDDICVKQHNGEKAFFNSKGLYNILGECLLFPSKEMRDWRKFAWKKGDVLISNDYGTEVIFYNWYDDTYTNFYGKHRLDSENKNNIKYNDAFLCITGRYSLEDKDAAQTYINTIEERLGGKLNRETWEIEKQPEFKDGDILSNPSTALSKNHIFIFSKFNKYKDFEYHVALTASGEITIPTSHGVWCRKDSGVKYATEEEKQQLFSALAKEGKAWDSEKKQIVDLKPKVDELKPFDKVLVRDYLEDKWMPNFFSCYDGTSEYKYGCIAGNSDNVVFSKYCIPYNEETKHLLGTTDEWKGGE